MTTQEQAILFMICERYPDQPMEYVMGEYEKVLKLNKEIEERLVNGYVEQKECIEEKPQYTRKDLVVKPKNAIQNDKIYCCICGKKMKSITSMHLKNHNISVEDYKKLCGYNQDTVLMSDEQYSKSREVIEKAQQARLGKE